MDTCLNCSQHPCVQEADNVAADQGLGRILEAGGMKVVEGLRAKLSILNTVRPPKFPSKKVCFGCCCQDLH